MSLEEDLTKILTTLPISSWEYPRIGLAIPIGKSLEHADMVFYNFMFIASQGPYFIQCPSSVRIDVVRNNIGVQVLRSQLTHVLMLDSDHVHPLNIMQQFAKWALIRPDALVISGLNFRRKEPYDPVAGNLTGNGIEREIFTEWQPGLTPVDEVGGASLFIHRSVFERIEPPWFFNVYDHAWENNYPGEDIGFCQKCREAGIQPYVDPGITSPHCTETLVTENTFRQFMARHPERFA